VTNSNYMDVEDLEVYKKFSVTHLLNGLEKTLERKVPERERCWHLTEKTVVYGVNDESFPQGCMPSDT
jgi:hypothetical protein